MSESSTQTDQQLQGVPQARGRKRKLIEVHSEEDSEEDSEDSDSSEDDDSENRSDSDDDDCVIIAVTYNAPVYNSLFVQKKKIVHGK